MLVVCYFDEGLQWHTNTLEEIAWLVPHTATGVQKARQTVNAADLLHCDGIICHCGVYTMLHTCVVTVSGLFILCSP